MVLSILYACIWLQLYLVKYWYTRMSRRSVRIETKHLDIIFFEYMSGIAFKCITPLCDKILENSSKSDELIIHKYFQIISYIPFINSMICITYNNYCLCGGINILKCNNVWYEMVFQNSVIHSKPFTTLRFINLAK